MNDSDERSRTHLLRTPGSESDQTPRFGDVTFMQGLQGAGSPFRRHKMKPTSMDRTLSGSRELGRASPPAHGSEQVVLASTSRTDR